MNRFWTGSVLAVFFCVHAASLPAQVVPLPVRPPVDHPFVVGDSVRTMTTWRKGVERFGETLAEESLRLRGYEVINHKLPGNQGIDLIAVKRSASGAVADIRLVEVKTHYGRSVPRLGRTQAGVQMSRTWLAEKLLELRSTGPDGRRLALEISRFHRTGGVPLESLGELHDINLRIDRYVLRNSVTKEVRAGPFSVDRLLRNVVAYSAQPEATTWARRCSGRWNEIQSARMSDWLQQSARSRAFDKVSQTKLAALGECQALQGAKRAWARAAGRIAIVVALAADAFEVYGHVRARSQGQITRREFMLALSRSGGGITAAWASAWAGAQAGGWLGGAVGSFFGPGGIPIGALLGAGIGSAIGGIGGYFGGSYAAGSVGEGIYRVLDQRTRDEVNRWFQRTAQPGGN
jgi:Holliday junction resolvase-like predicted endonuclease